VIFGGKRKKAKEVAIAAIRPLIAANQVGGGLSTAMYFDPYILGYLSSTIGWIIRLELNGKASASHVGYAMQDAFSEVCNVNGGEAATQIIALTETRDPEFEQGVEHASVSVLFSYGLLRDESTHPIVQDAENVAKLTGGSLLGGDHRSAVGAAIVLNTFNLRVRELRGDIPNA
jgi:hypothetical protein